MAKKQSTVKVTKVSAPVLQTGSDNLYYCKWSFKKNHTDSFSWEWQYTVNGSTYFAGSSGSTKYSDGAAAFTSTYSPPSNATAIRFRVKPIAKKKNSKSKYYTGVFSAWVKGNKVNVYPQDPSAPSIGAISPASLVMEIRYGTNDPLAKSVSFEVVLDNKTVCYRATINIVTGVAITRFTAAPGASYKVRCRTYNGTFPSNKWSEYSSEVYTIPGQITKGMIIRTSTESAVQITLKETILGAVKYVIQYANNTEDFNTSGNVTTITTDEVVGNTFYVSGLSATAVGGVYYFRVAAVDRNNNQGPWSPIGMPGSSITLGTTPSAPTTWQSASSVKVGEPITLYWMHNSRDGSKERKAIVRFINLKTNEVHGIEVPPKKEPTYIQPTEDKPNFLTTTQYTENEYTWAVQTYGIVSQPSPWSVERKISFYQPPVISLTVYKDNEWWWSPFDFKIDDIYTAFGEYKNPYSLPDEVIPHFPLFIEISIVPLNITPLEAIIKVFAKNSYETSDYDGETKWVNSGEEIFSRVVTYEENNDNKIHFPLLPQDISLEDGETYILRCNVAMSNGLSGTEEVEFTVRFDQQDYDVNAYVEYDKDLACCYVQPFCTEPESEDDPDTEDFEPPLIKKCKVSVYRKNFDGEFILIAGNLNNVDRVTVLDPHPTLKKVVYRIVSMSMETGAIYYNDLEPMEINDTDLIVQWDETWRDMENYFEELDDEAVPAWTGRMLRLPYDVDTSDSSDIDKDLVNYIGRSHPVSYYGTQLGQKVSLSSNLPNDDTLSEKLETIRSLQRWLGDVYIREPSGIGYWASISISTSITHCDLKVPVRIEAIRVEGGV